VPRTVATIDGDGDRAVNEILVMPAFGPEGVGAKVITIARGNPTRGLPLIQGSYVLFSPDGLSPELIIDASALTSLRTAAVSALATRHLARSDSRNLVVFGAGAQGEAHIHAMLAVLPIERVTIVASSPSSQRAQDLAARLESLDVDVTVGAPNAVADADIVCTCTTSTEPVFDGTLLPLGAHVNAVGAYRHDMCELDAQLLARATVVVETLEAAAAEAGDLLRAIAVGLLPAEHFAYELADIVGGQIRRRDRAEVTVFKSVGLSVEDLVVARAAADRLCVSQGLDD
jgi:ornithine cyclodeaminase